MPNNIFIQMQEEVERPSWFCNVEPFVEKVLAKLKIDNWELSILFCNDEFIADLNKQYRNVEGATDVLSFEQGDEYVDENDFVWFSAGDIVISLETLQTNCTSFNVTPNEELKRLLVHGVLHLNGMDHSDNSPEQEMLVFQEKILLELAEEIVYV